MTAIEIKNVSKRYGSLQALKDISLSIGEGEFFGLLGPNGAGKTTLISIMAGLAGADAGTVRIMGHNVVTHFQAARKNIGVVPQELVFDPFFTVRETLRLQSGYFGLKKNDDWIDEVMHNLGLKDKANTNMRALSGGMKRRVLVAQALVHKPPVIVLDEPTAGVDVELRQTLWQFIGRLNRKEKHTVVLTTHYLEEAQTWCSRIAMLQQGSIVALDTTEALIHQAADTRLVIQLDAGELPETLLTRYKTEKAAADSGVWTLAIKGPADIERILFTLREAGLTVADMQLNQPDLEEVFVRIMQHRN
ncbi:MAG: ABC transporter ATP-binding protein [Oxalobacter formigenes]|nr:ABC transporter ATP-binding protein [Oxalobacter formigenes]